MCTDCTIYVCIKFSVGIVRFVDCSWYRSTLTLKEIFCDLLYWKPSENQENFTKILIIVKLIPDFFCNSYQGMVCRKLSFVKAFEIFKNSFILEWIKAFFFRHKNKIDQDSKWLRENIFVKFKKLKRDTIWTCCFFILNLLLYWWFNFIYCGSWEENSIFNWFF